MNMNKWKWDHVPGSDLHCALRWANRALRPTSYLEIGVDGGGSLTTVLKEHKPGRIVLVDMWGTNHAGHGFENWDHITPILKSYGVTGRTTMVTGNSLETVPTIAPGFDLILVDGAHDEETALGDLQNAWPLLNKGGMLILDDYGHSSYPGVRAALERFSQPYKVIEEEGAAYRNCIILTR
jgi:predicted O-methyltransferase YrrM